MSKKVFTVLLLAVFMLAQFSVASAIAVDGDASITSAPVFTSYVDVDIDWAVTGMAAGTKNILLWAREYADPAVAYTAGDCQLVATIVGTSDASGTFTYDYAFSTLTPTTGDVIEFTVTVDDALCGAADLPDTDSVMGSSTVDDLEPFYLVFSPPSLSIDPPDNRAVACNTFEYWALASDHLGFPSNIGYSGLGDWNAQVTGTFAPPTPIGPGEDLLSWETTFPATASGPWSFSIQPEDAAGNQVALPFFFRDAYAIQAGETDDCATFSDVSGHEYETYIRYLATLDLISGFADGTFGPDNTLTRAEAATLIEISNGYDEASLPTAAPSADCTFTDVSASDWFAGWVWQACADGFMNGIGGGLFDPNNLLTRGQIVTVLNNVAIASLALFDGFIDQPTTLNPYWGLGFPFPMRSGAWTDVSIGAFYAEPVIQAYGWGVAEGTSDTTFSPDQPVTRGEFAMMLYRALSRVA
jgi:hypothetical protein